jgi:hypothetical protein
LYRSKTSAWEAIIAFVTRPVVAIVSIGLVIVINTLVLYHEASPGVTYAIQSDPAFLDEYNQTVSFYNVENMEP